MQLGLCFFIFKFSLWFEWSLKIKLSTFPTLQIVLPRWASENKMILLEPRAYSESQQIADYLKNKNTVVVNMKRVTPDQAKRIVDFLSGTVYAIGGDLQKIGVGIFLCTPRNINVEGSISEDEDKQKKDNEDIDLDW